ncbi:MAG: hypothetical protein WC679_02520 [Bacteroidales bacterium]|jgi:hypothetical protein
MDELPILDGVFMIADQVNRNPSGFYEYVDIEEMQDTDIAETTIPNKQRKQYKKDKFGNMK